MSKGVENQNALSPPVGASGPFVITRNLALVERVVCIRRPGNGHGSSEASLRRKWRDGLNGLSNDKGFIVLD